MGLDIRTNRKVDYPVYAAADGYIARVSVQAFGFGQAIYIKHPNGYTTVYGHLNSFFPGLGAAVEKAQYQKESWAVDLTFPPEQFPVKKGQLIAHSGNTGGSQGPHLHFEIRDTKTEECLNPLLFGYLTDDRVPPTIAKLAMYDRHKSLYVQQPRMFPVVKGASGTYSPIPKTIITGSDKISFSINANDRTAPSSGPNGIYAAKICMDDELVSEFKLERIGYNETLYLNAQIDYGYKHKGGVYLQQLSPLPGDRGPVYHTGNPDGLIHLRDTLAHAVDIDVVDANGNLATLRFTVKFRPSGERTQTPVGEKFPPGHISVFERDSFEAYIKEKSLYDTVYPVYSVQQSRPEDAISASYRLNDASVPVHENFIVRIKPEIPVPAVFKNKVLIKRTDGAGSSLMKAGWEGDWLTASSGNFGSFQAFIDKDPPVLKGLADADTLDLSRSNSIQLRPEDNFKEIRSFRAELDGKWLMFTNDKGRTFIYRFDERCPYGIHHLKVTVEDLAGNKTVKEWWFKRTKYTPVPKKTVSKKKS